MAPGVGEQVRLRFQPRSRPRDDRFPQREGRLANRDDEHRFPAKAPVHVAHGGLDILKVSRMVHAKLRDHRGIVVHLLPGLQRIDRLVDIVGQPERLNRDADVGIVLHHQRSKVPDA
jgi:hypothetical protein